MAGFPSGKPVKGGSGLRSLCQGRHSALSPQMQPVIRAPFIARLAEDCTCEPLECRTCGQEALARGAASSAHGKPGGVAAPSMPCAQ